MKFSELEAEITRALYRNRVTHLLLASLAMLAAAFIHAAALPLSCFAFVQVTAVVMYWPRDISTDRSVIVVFGLTVAAVILFATKAGIENGHGTWLDTCEVALRKHGR